MKHKCHFQGCNKNIKLVETITNKCKCGYLFCSKHKHAETHNCTYDYTVDTSKEIMKNACKGEKVIKI